MDQGIYYAIGNASSEANTDTLPSLLVTSTATATATSNVSQKNAQEVANNTAQNVANSVAQHDANLITQVFDTATCSIKGRFSGLNIYEAMKCGLSPNEDLTGVIITPDLSSNINGAITITFQKQIYYTDNLSPIQKEPINLLPDATIKGHYQLTYLNLNELSSDVPLGTKSILTGVRIAMRYDPRTNTTYNISIISNVTLYCSIIINSETTLAEFKKSIISIIIHNKMAQNVNTYENNIINKYQGVVITETYSLDNKWCYCLINFDNANLVGSSNNIYPVQLSNNK